MQLSPSTTCHSTRLRSANVSVYVSVRLSVCMCMYVCTYAELELEIGRPFIKIRNIIMDYQMSFPLKMYGLAIRF